MSRCRSFSETGSGNVLRAPLERRYALGQLALWLGFAAAYELVRGLADGGGTGEALRNARRVVSLERHLGGLPELALEGRAVAGGAVLLHAIDWSYWIAHFAVVPAAVIWAYACRRAVYPRLRNSILLANTAALLGYLAFPTAPPRMLPQDGFVDLLAHSRLLSQTTGLVKLFANPYAAMPSVHTADAVVVGVLLAAAVRHPLLKLFLLLWPLWVCFVLMASANHYWLDLAAGAALAAVAVQVARLRLPPSLRSPRVQIRIRPAQARAIRPSSVGHGAAAQLESNDVGS
jgi:membrane-associated phospholipid phosphatase